MKNNGVPDDFRTINRGPCVGGPFDGTEAACHYYLREYPEGTLPPDATIHRVFSKGFPEGAIYLWNPETKTWNYAGVPKDNSGFLDLLNAFGVKPAPPFKEE